MRPGGPSRASGAAFAHWSFSGPTPFGVGRSSVGMHSLELGFGKDHCDLVVRSLAVGPEGSRFETRFCQKSAMYVGLVHAKSGVKGPTSSR
ncbi:hypothetical protein AVEN_40853-1 [Araneus ventricosus]|uniref:Uncharacterized protein n=1 Tax=Araneus ventricosus TaxID=182803 RepID=A0A4Y2SYJ3_ARAVE|nr:hypothetical protein AVEN_40853-1 [Araneus ventricosus]